MYGGGYGGYGYDDYYDEPTYRPRSRRDTFEDRHGTRDIHEMSDDEDPDSRARDRRTRRAETRARDAGRCSPPADYYERPPPRSRRREGGRRARFDDYDEADTSRSPSFTFGSWIQV